MALVKCPECGRENVSDSADMCPNCGYGIKVYYDKCKQEEKDKRLKEERERQKIIEEEKRRQLKVENRIKRRENMKKAFGSPIKIIAWVFAVLVVIVSIVALFIWLSKNSCSIGNCNKYRKSGSYYCIVHTCEEAGCYSSKNQYDDYCFKHKIANTCSYFDCEKYEIEGGEYCYSHTCDKSGCYNKKGYDSNYCIQHQQKNSVDMRKRLTDSSFSFYLNSAGGIEFDFKAKNSTGKEIKYVRLQVELRNAVDDLVKEEIKGTTSVRVEIVGPIKAGGTVSMEDNIIGYCDTCARIDIGDITIVYKDGTSETGYYGYYYKK